MTSPTEPAKSDEPKAAVEEAPKEPEFIKLKDKYLILLFCAWEKHRYPGFTKLKIEFDCEYPGSEIISVYLFAKTPEASQLEDDWNMGRPIAVPDLHWIEDEDRNFKRVVRRNRNQ